MQNENKPKVGAGLTILSFRKNLEELFEEYEKNVDLVEFHNESLNQNTENEIEPGELLEEVGYSDLSLIKNKVKSCYWSAPKQDLKAGVLFFYMGKTAATNITNCIKESIALPDNERNEIQKLLQQDKILIDKYKGSIFGACKVLGIPGTGSGPGFKSRVFAEIESDNFHFFENPLPFEHFKSLLPIYGQTVSQIVAQKAEWLRFELAKTNELPDWFREMKFGETRYSSINSRNWLKKITEPFLFIDDNHKQEDTIRTYFLDFLINEIKDNDSYYLTECNTFRNGKRTGRADYFLKIADVWVPFEAKVSVAAEKDITSQLLQYLDLDYFEFIDTPNFSFRKKKKSITKHGICLIGDQHGIYLSRHGKFLNCSQEKPLWPRTEINRKTLAEIRAVTIEKLCET